MVAVEGETYLLRETAVQPQDAAVEGDRWLARHSDDFFSDFAQTIFPYSFLPFKVRVFLNHD